MSNPGHFQCRICGDKGPFGVLRAREMMFGTKDEFDYLVCPTCGTIQLAEIPDLSKYYSEDYYSFDCDNVKGWRKTVARLATKAYFHTRGLPMVGTIFEATGALERLVDRGLGLKAFLDLSLPMDARILDVGCGSAALLKELATLGYTSLKGIDKFLRNEIHGQAIVLRAAEISELDGEFDVIMFNHSLEHIADPRAALRAAHRLLSEAGTCLVRLPVISYALEKYGVNWVGLDAPRHLALMNESTARDLMESSGFLVTEVVYDSTSFQFSASEKYSLDIPLVVADEPFSKRQYREWRFEARRLNREGRGDQAAFILKKQS